MMQTGITLTRFRRTAAVLVVGLALAAVPGCIGGSEEDDAGDAVKDYTEAIADGDEKKICETLSKDSRKQLEKGDRKCEDAYKNFGAFLNDEQKDKLKDVDPDVEVDGDNATAKVDELGSTGSNEVKLKKEDGDWKITFEQ
jgi:Domain of unknown function (DUF4878)